MKSLHAADSDGDECVKYGQQKKKNGLISHHVSQTKVRNCNKSGLILCKFCCLC